MFVGVVRQAWRRNEVGNPKFVESAVSTNAYTVSSPVQAYPPFARIGVSGSRFAVTKATGHTRSSAESWGGVLTTEATIPAAAPGRGHAIFRSDSREDISSSTMASPSSNCAWRCRHGLESLLKLSEFLCSARTISNARVSTGWQGWRADLAGGGLFPTPASIASASRYEQGLEFLKVNIHLTSPEMLFARQRNRSLLFGGLIAAWALAAIIGFDPSARRAFLRQQQLSEMKSNFVSSVSHELRAPIASVRLLAESLERGTIS